ncbi:MAG: hypothetical protein HFF18_02485 [Oscillospiraceae bacterium]|nr:hypothetical protein [Oscillospiraceae bacterium]
MSILYLTAHNGAESLSHQAYLSKLDYEIIKAIHDGVPPEKMSKAWGIYPPEIAARYAGAIKRLETLSKLVADTNSIPWIPDHRM